MSTRPLAALVCCVVPVLTAGAAEPPARSGRGHTVTICHVPPGNPEAAHTLTVAPPALKAHLAHGDTRGHCGERLQDGSHAQAGKKKPHKRRCRKKKHRKKQQKKRAHKRR